MAADHDQRPFIARPEYIGKILEENPNLHKITVYNTDGGSVTIKIDRSQYPQ